MFSLDGWQLAAGYAAVTIVHLAAHGLRRMADWLDS